MMAMIIVTASYVAAAVLSDPGAVARALLPVTWEEALISAPACKAKVEPLSARSKGHPAGPRGTARGLHHHPERILSNDQRCPNPRALS